MDPRIKSAGDKISAQGLDHAGPGSNLAFRNGESGAQFRDRGLDGVLAGRMDHGQGPVRTDHLAEAQHFGQADSGKTSAQEKRMRDIKNVPADICGRGCGTHAGKISME